MVSLTSPGLTAGALFYTKMKYTIENETVTIAIKAIEDAIFYIKAGEELHTKYGGKTTGGDIELKTKYLKMYYAALNELETYKRLTK